MELHFCSQCGISIPLAEIQSGAAGAGDGRTLCTEHRPGATPSDASHADASRPDAASRTGAKPASGATSVAVADGKSPGDVELLFCANCTESVPVADVHAGRAKREFGSLFCAPCSAADTDARDRRRKAVAAEMAGDADAPASATDAPRRCVLCAAPVPTALIASGRALADGNRVVCPRCREAGATLPRVAAPASSGWGTGVLVVLLVAAFGAAGFFGAEYYKARQTPVTPPASAKEIAALRTDLDRRIAELAAGIAERDEASKDARKDEADLVQVRLSEEILAVREDLADVRSRLSVADNDLAQRVAKLEGHVGMLQEMLKGLAARPAVQEPSRPNLPPNGPGNGGPSNGPPDDTRPPEGPAPEGPKAPDVAPGAQVNPEVTRLVKELLEGAEAGVRFAAATELTRRKERTAIPAFAKQVIDDANLIVRRACARGLGEVRAWNAVPVLIQALEDKEAYVAQQANFALQAIAGQDFGVTIESDKRERKSKATSALKWWEKNRDAPPDGACLDPIALPK